jgi:paraquat-inducible protein B
MQAQTPETPSVVLHRKRGLPIVWIIPIVAAAVGGWIWWSALQEVGPSITLTFETATGLEAGKTKIRFKDVELGLVESVQLDEDLSGVTVTCQLAPLAAPLLRDSTRFWVVRPRIGAGGISGLDTLVSGAHIALDPGSTGTPALSFTGLELPPVSLEDAPGLKLVLVADSLGSLSIGSPVYYRDFLVGHVERHHLADDDRSVEIEVYIEAEHRRLVTATTRFWNTSGISLDLTADGFSLQAESLESLLSGGVAFETPEADGDGAPAENGGRYQLYESLAEARDVYADSVTYMMDFQGSVRGLAHGAPVEFRGIKLGHVTEIWMEFHPEELQAHIIVLAEVQRDRVRRLGGDPKEDRQLALESLVKGGMRARLATGSLLTGALYVELDFHPNTEAVLSGLHPEYMEVPTIPSATETLMKTLEELPLAQIFDEAAAAMHQISQLAGSERTEQALADLAETLGHARSLARTLDQDTPGALTDLRGTLASAQELLQGMTAEESELNFLLTQTLGELSSTLRSVRVLADYLERHPEALVSGKPSGGG